MRNGGMLISNIVLNEFPGLIFTHECSAAFHSVRFAQRRICVNVFNTCYKTHSRVRQLSCVKTSSIKLCHGALWCDSSKCLSNSAATSLIRRSLRALDNSLTRALVPWRFFQFKSTWNPCSFCWDESAEMFWISASLRRNALPISFQCIPKSSAMKWRQHSSTHSVKKSISIHCG